MKEQDCDGGGRDGEQDGVGDKRIRVIAGVLSCLGKRSNNSLPCTKGRQFVETPAIAVRLNKERKRKREVQGNETVLMSDNLTCSL